ncbi:MAG: hypothetical protein JWO70_4726 [Betaproteobacteria bacterium]|nr:hypothetical protein [Betaproteobacteria bacterium]
MQNTGMQGSTAGASTVEKLTEQATERLGRLSETAHETMGRVSDIASQTASRLRDRSQQLLDHPAVGNARSYVREHPVAAIGIAIAVGLLISRLTSRR